MFGSVGVGPGEVAQWRVTILKAPCCGYTGIAKESKRGNYESFADQATCVGFSNFSGDRSADLFLLFRCLFFWGCLCVRVSVC